MRELCAGRLGGRRSAACKPVFRFSSIPRHGCPRHVLICRRDTEHHQARAALAHRPSEGTCLLRFREPLIYWGVRHRK